MRNTSFTLWKEDLSSSSSSSLLENTNSLSFAVEQSLEKRTPFPPLPKGMFIAKHFLLQQTVEDTPVVVIGQLCGKGDHTADGIELANTLWNSMIHQQVSQKDGTKRGIC